MESEDIASDNFFEVNNNQTIISSCCNYESNFTLESPYDCAFLEELPLGYNLLSDPIEGFSINFNDLEQMRYFRNNQFKKKLTLKSTKIGTIHAVVMWFRLFYIKFFKIFLVSIYIMELNFLYLPKIIRVGNKPFFHFIRLKK